MSSTVVGVKSRVNVSGTAEGRIEAGRYVWSEWNAARHQPTWTKTLVPCPLCVDHWLQRPSCRPSGRVLVILSEPANGYQQVLSDPLPRSHTALSCGRCKCFFTLPTAKLKQLAALSPRGAR